MIRFFRFAAACAATFLCTNTALADVTVGGESYLGSASGLGTGFTLAPWAKFDVGQSLLLEAKWPIVGLNINGLGGETRAALGNPGIGAYYKIFWNDELKLYVGGRAYFPMLSLLDDRDMAVAAASSLAIAGAYDFPHWDASALPLGAYGGVEAAAAKNFFLRGELGLYVHIPARSGRDTTVLTQTRVAGEFRTDAGIGGGLALQGVFIFTESSDRAQLAMEPYFAFERGEGFVRVGILCALDRPLGFCFDEGRPITAHVNGGVRF